MIQPKWESISLTSTRKPTWHEREHGTMRILYNQGIGKKCKRLKSRKHSQGEMSRRVRLLVCLHKYLDCTG